MADREFIEAGERCASCENVFIKPQGRRKWCISCVREDYGANVSEWRSDYPEIAAQFA